MESQFVIMILFDEAVPCSFGVGHIEHAPIGALYALRK
jgi:hypothetical protein